MSLFNYLEGTVKDWERYKQASRDILENLLDH